MLKTHERGEPSTAIYAPSGELLGVVMSGSVWFPEDLALLYPDLAAPSPAAPAAAPGTPPRPD